MDNTPQNYAQPLRNLLSFMTGVLRKPWNEPPGDVVRVERGEVVPFPVRPRAAPERSRGQAAAISAATDAAAAERAAHPEAAPPPATPHDVSRLTAIAADARSANADSTDRLTNPLDDPLHDPRKQRKVPDLIGDPTPAETSALDPGSPAREAVEDPDLPLDEDADAASAARIDSQPVIAAAAAAAVSEAAPAPHPMPVPEGTPSWKLAAQGIRENPAATPAPPPQKPATPRVAAAPHSAPMPHAAPASARPPALASHYSPRVPRTAAGMLVAGAALLIVVGLVATSFHHTPTELIGKQGIVDRTVGTADAVPTATAAAPVTATNLPAVQPRPSAAIPMSSPIAAPTTASHLRQASPADEDEDAVENGVAAPYSTPIAGQAAAAAPSYAATSQQAPAPVVRQSRPPSDEIASAAPGPQQPGVPAAAGAYTPQSYAGGSPASAASFHPELHAAYRNPDSMIVGDMPRGGSRSVLSDHPGYLEVSSGVMAGNLVAAPMPDYPTIARLAHVGGEVILQAVINRNGRVATTHVLSGHRLLRGAAEDAVRRWRYRPYMMDGRPVEVATIVTVRFRPKK